MQTGMLVGSSREARRFERRVFFGTELGGSLDPDMLSIRKSSVRSEKPDYLGGICLA